MNTDPGYHNPTIAVDREQKRIACFDDFTEVRPYEDYTDEMIAMKEAHDWFKDRTIHVPQVIYPRITKLRFW